MLLAGWSAFGSGFVCLGRGRDTGQIWEERGSLCGGFVVISVDSDIVGQLHFGQVKVKKLPSSALGDLPVAAEIRCWTFQRSHRWRGDGGGGGRGSVASPHTDRYLLFLIPFKVFGNLAKIGAGNAPSPHH